MFVNFSRVIFLHKQNWNDFPTENLRFIRISTRFVMIKSRFSQRSQNSGFFDGGY
jgi:hypothetical protein